MRWIKRTQRPVGRSVMVFILASVLGVMLVYSRGSIFDLFDSHYGSNTIGQYTDSETGDSCLACHVLPRRGTDGNAYRRDLLTTTDSGNSASDFDEIDMVDSDGDGLDNQTEANFTRVHEPTLVSGVPQVGYNPGLIDCSDGRLGYDPVSMQVITMVNETPPGGIIWNNEVIGTNCDDNLDNDCDGMMDADDPDCDPTGCMSDAECDDGEFCNGMETCDVASGDCLPGTAVDCGDGVACTMDMCNEAGDTCVNTPDSGFCDNGQFCDGVETCNLVTDCQPGMAPCGPGENCDETGDTCVPAGCMSDAECDDGQYCNGAETCNVASGNCLPGTPVDCGDGVACTVDMCNEAGDTCVNTPDNGFCDNGQFCDGTETCDVATGCQPGMGPVVDDGVGCTDDSCDEASDMIVHAPNNANCDNGQFCDGTETCDVATDCQPGMAPCGPGENCDETGDTCVPAGCMSDAECDDSQYCNGAETCNVASGNCLPGTPVDCGDSVACTIDMCNEAGDTCVNTPDNGFCDNGQFCDGMETCNLVTDCQPGMAPCGPGENCDETGDTCVPAGCMSDAECDDSQYCNGAETCNVASGNCLPGTPVDCGDGVACTVDMCNEAGDTCVNTPDNGFCDNGQFCDGMEICDAVNDCQPGPPPCAAGQTCDEQGDQCALLDLDIVGFRVTKRVSLSRARAMEIKMVIKNDGPIAGTAEATVTGIQNGMEVYNMTLTVSDPVGNGRTRYEFPTLSPTVVGDIMWTVTLADADPDDDTATATSRVTP